MKKLIPILTLSALLAPLSQAQEGPRKLRPQLTDRPSQKTDKVDWTSIKKRIEGAVERGDITRGEADEKYIAIKKKLATSARQSDGRRPIANQSRPDALKKVLSELIAQKKINRDDARRIAEAASSNPPMRDQRSGANNELRETLEAAKQELAMLREAREHLMGQHNEHLEKREYMEREKAARQEEMNRERAHVEMKREIARAKEHIQEQQEKSAKMREQAERRMREIAEQTKKLEERRKAIKEKEKKEQ